VLARWAACGLCLLQNPAMPLDVQWTLLERRRDKWRALEDVGEWMVELWIVLDGANGEAAEQLVAAAADQAWGSPPGGRWAVTGSAQGTYVARTTTADWRTVIEGLLAALGEVSGRVSVPPAVPGDPASGRVVAQAFLAFSMDPPASAGPFNPNGTVKLRWGVSPDLTTHLVEDAVGWASAAGQIGRVGNTLPATPADAARLLQRTWASGNYQHGVLFVADMTAARARAVALAEFGLTSWTELRAGASLADDARVVTERLVHFAGLLDHGHIGPGTTTRRVDRDEAMYGTWAISRSLWDTFVPAAYSVQLLTAAQLERTNDLSRWDVQRINDNRWLVTAKDFDAWWDIPDLAALRSLRAPDPQLLAQAAADFGDAIITAEQVT
jgi:hypothetical protein